MASEGVAVSQLVGRMAVFQQRGLPALVRSASDMCAHLARDGGVCEAPHMWSAVSLLVPFGLRAPGIGSSFSSPSRLLGREADSRGPLSLSDASLPLSWGTVSVPLDSFALSAWNLHSADLRVSSSRGRPWGRLTLRPDCHGLDLCPQQEVGPEGGQTRCWPASGGSMYSPGPHGLAFIQFLQPACHGQVTYLGLGKGKVSMYLGRA